MNKTLPNGLAEQKTHDALNRTSTIKTVDSASNIMLACTHTWDLASNLEKIDETYPGGSLPARTVENTYDRTHRLTKEKETKSGATVTTTFDYDKNNNRTAKTLAGAASGNGTTSYLIGTGGNGAAANQILSFTRPDTTTVTFTHDDNGNRLTRTEGGNTDDYEYDYDNRLVDLDYQTGSSGAGAYHYRYDHRTRRVLRSEPGTATEITFNGGTSAAEYDNGTANPPTVEYIRGSGMGGGIGGILYTARSGTYSHNHHSARGDVTAKSDATGALTYEAAYEAFGTRTGEAGSTPDRAKKPTPRTKTPPASSTRACATATSRPAPSSPGIRPVLWMVRTSTRM